MLDLIAGIGGGLFVLMSLFVGGRLTCRGLRSRDLPELSIGGGLLLAGALGYPMVMAAQLAVGLPDAVRIAFFWGHVLCNIVGLGGLAYFTWRVFRPDRTWARILWLAIPGAELVGALAQLLGPGPLAFIDNASQGPWQLNMYVVCVVLGWAGLESLLHYGRLRRRVAIGLAAPAVANRICLWGIAMLASASITVLTLGLEALGVRVLGTVAGALITGPLGLVSAVSLYLAFTPPRAYLRWVSRGARAHPAG